MFGKKKKFNSEVFQATGEYIVAIRLIPEHRICVRNCSSHVIIIEGRRLLLECKTVVDKKRDFIYQLEEPFREGKLIISLSEKSFNKVILEAKIGFFAVLNQRKILLNSRIEIPIDGYKLERGY